MPRSHDSLNENLFARCWNYPILHRHKEKIIFILRLYPILWSYFLESVSSSYIIEVCYILICIFYLCGNHIMLLSCQHCYMVLMFKSKFQFSIIRNFSTLISETLKYWKEISKLESIDWNKMEFPLGNTYREHKFFFYVSRRLMRRYPFTNFVLRS